MCYLSTGRVFVSPPIQDLDQLLTELLCDGNGKCTVEAKPLRWYCAALSQISEAHSGYISFNTGLDYVVARLRDVCFGNI